MSSIETNWTKEDLKIYILIFCANADLSESKFEIDFIKSKIQTSDFEKLDKEFLEDNDYQSIQKIQSSIDEHGLSQDEIYSLFSEMKELFLKDNKYDILEKNLFRGLNRILK